MDLQRQLSNLTQMLKRLLEQSFACTPTPPRQARQLQPQHRLTTAEQAELAHRYVAGESVTALKQAFSINRETVLLQLKRAGVTRSPSVRKLNDDEVREAALLYTDGRSLRMTAEKFGVSERTLRRELAAAGHAIRPRRGR